MREQHQPICIQCGQRAGDPTRFNRLPDGRPCPICAERLLLLLPPLLPAGAIEDDSALADSEPNDADLDFGYDKPA